jgi:hypothetical protein
MFLKRDDAAISIILELKQRILEMTASPHCQNSLIDGWRDLQYAAKYFKD